MLTQSQVTARDVFTWAARVIAALTCMLSVCIAHAKAPANFNIDVAFALPQSHIVGKVIIEAEPGEALLMHRGSLTIKSVVSGGRDIMPALALPESFTLQAAGAVEIDYEGTLTNADEDFIDADNLVLRKIWYPFAEGAYRFRIAASVPSDFVLVSEGARTKRMVRRHTARYIFETRNPQPAWDGVSLVGSREWLTRYARINGVPVTVHVKRENADRVHQIIRNTRYHLRSLQALLGPYPHRSLTIAEHPLPVSYSLAMAGYVLLSAHSLRSTDEGESALSHELAHQWFGKGVFTSPDDGNWSEGLATYFGDYRDEAQGHGWAVRQRYMAGYQNNVSNGHAIALSDFWSTDAPNSEYIGYERCALVFHMLRQHLGDARFLAGTRRLLDSRMHRLADWRDIEAAYEIESAEDLRWFFRQWVEQAGIPQLEVSAPELDRVGEHRILKFTLTQGGPLFSVELPLTLEFRDGRTETRLLSFSRERRAYRVAVDREPVRATLDRSYDVLRSLEDREFPPSFDRLLARRELVLVAQPRDAATFAPLIDALRAAGTRIRWYRSDGVDPAITRASERSSMMFLKRARQLGHRILSARRASSSGFVIDILKHPRTAGEVIAIVQTQSRKEAELATAHLLQDRDYSFASFRAGRWKRYSREAGGRGIVVFDRVGA